MIWKYVEVAITVAILIGKERINIPARLTPISFRQRAVPLDRRKFFDLPADYLRVSAGLVILADGVDRRFVIATSACALTHRPVFIWA